MCAFLRAAGKNKKTIPKIERKPNPKNNEKHTREQHTNTSKKHQKSSKNVQNGSPGASPEGAGDWGPYFQKQGFPCTREHGFRNSEIRRPLSRQGSAPNIPEAGQREPWAYALTGKNRCSIELYCFQRRRSKNVRPSSRFSSRMDFW